MDNAARTWELPGSRMPIVVIARLVARVALAGLAIVALLLCATRAAASESAEALREANAALSASPPLRDSARTALLRATAANDDARSVGEAYLLLGQLDEDDGLFAKAIEDDEGAQAAAPNTRWSLRAHDRIEWIRARSEDGLRPLVRLESVRRDPAASSDPAAIDALARDLETFPPGSVRVEARMVVAEAWLGRMHRPDDAIAQLRLVVADPKTDGLTQRLAERELVDALAGEGRLDEAAAEARSHHAMLDARFVRQVLQLVARRSLRHASVGILAVFGLLALVALVRAAARGMLGVAGRALRDLAPVALPFVAFLALAGGLLATKYESGTATPFYLLGAAVFPLVLLARAWSAVGSPSTTARTARSLLCAATVAATAFTVLDQLDPRYLEGFGL
jgi:hypothetical protein